MHSRIGERANPVDASEKLDGRRAELQSAIGELEALLERIAALKQTLPAALIDEALDHLRRAAN